MTVATVKTVAARFLKSNKPEVLALKGAWGVGKTYAWNKLVLDYKNEISLPNYCYVSLFGIASIQELRTAIFTKIQSVKRLGLELDAKTINKEWFGIACEQTKKLFRFGSGLIKKLPYGKNVTVGLEMIAPHFIRNTIICLDDFERLATRTDAIKGEEILGLISELKEEKGCKVVLVFNEEKLSDKGIYSKYREKVVDIELLYDPTPEEAAEIAIPPELPCRESVKRHCIALKVKNIRVLRKIVTIFQMMHEVAENLHPQVMEQAAQTLVLLAWCYFDTDEKKPTIQFLRKWNTFMWSFKEKQEETDPQESAWNSLLQTYGLSHLDEFDLSIIDVIQRGYLEETGFVEAARLLDAQYRAQDLEQSFSDAWNLFHNSFKDNRDELIRTLYDSFKKSVKNISPINLSGTTSLLRELEKDDLADELIDFYLDARGEEDEILNLEDSHFSGDIKDQVIWERLKERRTKTVTLMPLVEAVKYIADNSGWSKKQIESLLAATEDDYYTLFKQDHGDQLRRIVSCCLQFDGYEDKLKPIGSKARDALVRIANENQLNAIRLRRYNILVKQPTTNPSDERNVVDGIPSAAVSDTAQ